MKAISSLLIIVAVIVGGIGGGSTARYPALRYELPIRTAVEGSVFVSTDGISDYDKRTAIGSKEHLDVSACELINKLFDNNLTELQREELWKSYKGRSVRWIGKVEDIKQLQEGIRATFSPGIEVVFDMSQMATLLALKKGELSVYSGNLDSFRYPYSPYTGDSKIKLSNGKMIVPEVVSLLWEKEVPIVDKKEQDMYMPLETCFLVVNDRIFKGPGEVKTWFGDFKVSGISRVTGEVTWEKAFPPPESVAQGVCRGGKLVAADNDGVYVCVWFQEHRGRSVYRDTYEIFALDGVTGKLTLQRSLWHEYWGLPYLNMKWEKEVNDLIRSIAGRELVFCTEQTLPKEATYGELVFKWSSSVYGGSLQACDRKTGCLLWSKQVPGLGPVVHVEIIGETLRVLTTKTFYAFKLAPATQSQVTVTLYAHEGSASGPIIIGAQVAGQDGAGNPFNKTTNSNGYVTITGVSGTWSLTVSKSGYGTNSWSQGITTTQTIHAYLTKQGAQSLAQLIQELTIDSVAVTVAGQSYFILTLQHRIDPSTLKVVADSGQTKVYVDASGNPISDGAIAQKIGIIETAREVGDLQLSQRIAALEGMRETASQRTGGDWLNLVTSGVVDSIKAVQWQKKYDLYSYLRYWDATRGWWQHTQEATLRTQPTGILAKAATFLIKKLFGDPFDETKKDLQNWLSSAINYYKPIAGMTNSRIVSYDEAYKFLSNFYHGRSKDDIASYLCDKVRHNVVVLFDSFAPLGKMYALVKDVPILSSTLALLEFPKLAEQARLATDWTVDTLYQDAVNRYQNEADLLYRLTDTAKYSLQLAQAHGEVRSYNKKYLNHIATGVAEAQKIPQAVYDYLADIDTWWRSAVTVVTLGRLRSPGEFRVYDSQGRVTGLVNGQLKEEIPDSLYADEAVLILSATDSYRYEVAGTDHGTYGLEITFKKGEEAEGLAFANVTIVAHEVHRYTIVGRTPSMGEAPATIEIDSDGNGFFEKTKLLGPPTATFTFSPSTISINKAINFDASQSSDADGQIVSYQWNFGDWNTTTGHVVTHTYSAPGEYVVSLAVVDNDGIVSTYSRFVQVGERQRMPTWAWAIIAIGILALAVIVFRKRRTAKVQH